MWCGGMEHKLIAQTIAHRKTLLIFSGYQLSLLWHKIVHCFALHQYARLKRPGFYAMSSSILRNVSFGNTPPPLLSPPLP